jgi:hypothetical protein
MAWRGGGARKTLGARARAGTVSSESIASPLTPTTAAERCPSCGAPLASDQRYCLECGERRAPMSSVMLGGPPLAATAGQGPGAAAGPGAPPPFPPRPPAGPPADPSRGGAVSVIAGVGVLLLAMGVGVLIGRSGGGSKQGSAPAQVITVAGPSSAATGGGAAAETTPFSDDWPAGTSGYTVQLQTLAQSGTQTSAVEAAKTAATAKGATGVGALKSEDFSSLKAGSYVIYSGVDHTRAQAGKALAKLKKKFPGAKVIKVSSGTGSTAAGSGAGASGAGASGAGASEKHPAPPKVVEQLSHVKGKNYEEQSKKLPDVISTG